MKRKIVKIFIAILMLLLTAFGYINIKYSEVNSQVRLRGFIMEQFINFDDAESLRVMSKEFNEMSLEAAVDLEYEEILIGDGRGGEVRTLIYRPANVRDNATGLLWLHGGGYAVGTPEGELGFAKDIIGETNSIIVVPDYTLSVDKPYPAALNDAYAVLLWMDQNAEALGINKNQIFIGGGSAGGGLTAALSLYARDQGEVEVAFQLPLFPMLNDKMDKPSGINNKSFVWNSERNRIAWEVYLGDYYGTKNVPMYAAALRAEDFSNLPPTYTYVGTLDPFADDTKAYVNELKLAGVDVEFHEYKGCYHGFEGAAPNSDIAILANSRLVEAYKNATEKYFIED